MQVNILQQQLDAERNKNTDLEETLKKKEAEVQY